METNIIYGILEIKEKEYPFFLDEHVVRIVDSSAIYITDFKDIEHLDTVYGVTSDGRSILFIDCSFFKDFFGVLGNTFTIKSYMLSYGNSSSTNFKCTRKIVFHSDAINMFYSPLNARKFIGKDDKRIEEKWREIKILPYSDTLKEFSYNGNTYAFGIGGSVNLKTGTEKIGELRSCLEINLADPADYTDVVRHTQNVFDFLRFINYSSNIKLDDIDLYRIKDDGKPVQYATYHIFQDATEYENNPRDSITISDFDFIKIGKLYGCVVSLRESDNKLHLYYPDNKHDRRFIDPITWLSKALVFEGLFVSCYPNYKSSTNQNFAAMKSAVIGKAKEVQGQNKHQREYITDIINYINRYNGNLEEKFNFVLKKYRTVLDPIIVSNDNRYKIAQDNNYGKIYMYYRNPVAHGDVHPLDKPQLAVYRLLEAMVYLLLIKDVGFTEEELKTIVNRLFNK